MVEEWPWAFFTAVSLRGRGAVLNQAADDMAGHRGAEFQEEKDTDDGDVWCQSIQVAARSTGMRPEPTEVMHDKTLSAELLFSADRRPTQSAHAMAKRSRSLQSQDRLRTLVTELRHHAPEWADRLSQATSEQQVLDIIAELFNLKHALKSPRGAKLHIDLSTRIKLFVRMNLHKGMTLKLLGEFLGYSEKYCSELFQATMGESFSEHVKRHRLEIAMTLLATTDRGVAEIAQATGFCDQFAFSHFFKRMTGRSPRDFRIAHTQRRPSRIPVSPH